MKKQMRPHICLTNDDGIRSPALRAIISELAPHYELTVVIPDTPRSGISKAISFPKPIRFMEADSIEKQSIIETTGTPGDAVVWFRTHYPDTRLIISGPNLGLNVSVHSILTSGTVGAAIEAALWNIPAIAFSIEAPMDNWFFPKRTDVNISEATRRAHLLIDFILERGLPPGVDLLNVNFPQGLNESVPTRIAPPTRIRFLNRIESRTDPHGNEYSWIVGNQVEDLSKSNDVYIATKDLHVVISPITIDLTTDSLIESTHKFFQPLID